MSNYKELEILIENAKYGDDKAIQSLKSILATLGGLEKK